MRFNGELLTPERGYTETLPWGAVRVAGRNRPDTQGNPSTYDVTFQLIGQAMVDWFGRSWLTEAAEGSVPIETGIGWAQVIGDPTYNNNTGRRATVNMTLEILEDVDYCLDESLLVVGEYFGDGFYKSARALSAAISAGPNGS